VTIQDARNYSPSWLSAFFRTLDHLPIPFWMLGLAYVIVLALIRHSIAWQQGVLPAGELSAFLIVNPAFYISLMTAWLYLDRRAIAALDEFYAGTRTSASQVARSQREFLSTPSWLAVGAVLLGLATGTHTFIDGPLRLQPEAAQVWPWFSGIGFAVNYMLLWLLLFRLLIQIRAMRKMLKSVKADLFNPYRVYALSDYGAAFALAITIATALPGIPVSQLFSTSTGFPALLIGALAILVVFFAPLLEINARMRAEKQRLLARIGDDLGAVQSAIHASVAKRKHAAVEKLHVSQTALREQRELVQKTPSWPWQTDTLRNVFSPLAIAVVAYLIQRYLGGLLGL
jgi:hypothetical protein